MTNRLLFALASLSLFAAAPGCTVNGSGHPDTGGGPPVDSGPGARDTGVITGDVLLIRPADQERTIMGAPVEIDYMAIHHALDGTETDVSAMATFSTVVSTLGTFAGAHFTSAVDHGGHTTIRATYHGMSAMTGLTLRLTRDIVATGAPADAATHFTGTPNPANAPMLVYPDDGVMVPPNLERFELHFLPNGSSLFRLDITTGPVTLRVFMTCSESVGGGCIYTPDHATWSTISDAARGLDPVTYTLTGTDSAGRIGTSAPRTIQFANENITGGVYYWNAAAGSIMRYEFGVPGAVEERYLAGGGPFGCIGCHTLSRDGTRIAVGIGIPTQIFRVYDVASRNQVFQGITGGGPSGAMGAPPDFFSFSPDSTQIVTSNPHGLNIADAMTGAVSAASHNITTGVSTMPDWSPDGQHIVYVSPGSAPAIEAPAVTGGSIVLVDHVAGTWTPGAVLAPAGTGNNYHPAYSPDGSWILFNRSPSNVDSMGGAGGSSGACVSDAQLWYVASSGGSAPIQLDNVGPPSRPSDGVCASWPKFDPTTYQDHGHPLFWVAWATGRGYGLRYADGSLMQIWMAAFDPTRAAAGMSPLHGAIRLPFQNIASGNHVAQWVTTIERTMCSTPADCPGGEFCYMGRCFQTPPAPT